MFAATRSDRSGREESERSRRLRSSGERGDLGAVSTEALAAAMSRLSSDAVRPSDSDGEGERQGTHAIRSKSQSIGQSR